MSYRIQVDSEVVSLLRTFAPHVVQQLARALALVAASLGEDADADGTELRVDNCVMRFEVNHAHRILQVMHVEQRPAFAAAGVTV